MEAVCGISSIFFHKHRHKPLWYCLAAWPAGQYQSGLQGRGITGKTMAVSRLSAMGGVVEMASTMRQDGRGGQGQRGLRRQSASHVESNRLTPSLLAGEGWGEGLAALHPLPSPPPSRGRGRAVQAKLRTSCADEAGKSAVPDQGAIGMGKTAR